MNKTLRIGLLSASATFFSIGLVLWDAGQALVNPVSLALSMGVWLLGALSAGLALLPSVPRRAAWLVLVACIALALHIVYLAGLNYAPLTAGHTDNEMIGKYALEALKRGQDPYEWNFSDLTRVYRDPGLMLTPFLDGSYQNRFTYPALPMLVLWAFDRVGLGQVRTVNAVFFVLLLILLFVGAPQKLRPLILLPLLVLSGFAETALSGAQDVVWCALLVGMILVWKRPMLRAVMFGLAAAFHQQPWVVAPFLLIALWYEGGTPIQRARRIALFAGISGGLFVLINLPFMLMDAQAWALGTFEPAYALFNMYSQGFATLSVFLPLPREFYTALQFALLAVALIVHLRHPRWIGPMFWLFPAVFFWVYYRGLANYWIFWIPPLLIALARGEYGPHPLPLLPQGEGVKIPHGEGAFLRSDRVRVSAAISLVILVIPIALGVHYVTARPLITASLDAPIVTAYGGGLSDQLTVTVTNDDDHEFRPRFAVQTEGGSQAQPWSILTGPESLNAGASAQYTIGNDNNYLTAFPTNAAAQVVVSDADGSYVRRALVTIPADSSADSPDLIHNPTFAYWNDDASLPIAWALQASNAVTVSLQQIEGHLALRLNIQKSAPSLTKLTQRITFPGSFTIWVHPAHEVSPTSSAVYGIEADDGFHRLWILFGSKQLQMVHAPANHAAIYQPAPLNVWSQQTVDLKQIYQQLGWNLPSFALDADHPVRQIDLSLIASDNQALFGTIDQDREAMSLDHLVADALSQPDQYYVYVAHRYSLQRDDEQAVQAYTTALSYNPDSADAYLGMAQSEWRLGKFDAGFVAFKQGLTLWMKSLTH